MKDIFDLNNLSDLPEELIREINLTTKVEKIILNLFLDGDGTLNLSKLIVGYYRKHDEIKTRQYMMTTCYRLVKKGFLSSTKNKGEYRITELGKNVIIY